MANLLRRAIQQSNSKGNFETTLYTGNASVRSLNTGVNSAANGAISWFKARDFADSHYLFDNVRGALNPLSPDTTTAEGSDVNSLTAFTSTGLDLGNSNIVNRSGTNFVLWQFLVAVGFLQIQEYTGNGAVGRAIPHGLGAQAGLVIIKRKDGAGDWWIQHISQGGDKFGKFTNAAFATDTTIWSNTAMDSTNVTVGSTAGGANVNTADYVMYTFAHNPTKGVYCGQYTGSGTSTGPVLVFGWQPRWIIIKKATVTTGNWCIFDVKRGMVVGADPVLFANSNATEVTGNFYLDLVANGVQIKTPNADVNSAGTDYIYMAIR